MRDIELTEHPHVMCEKEAGGGRPIVRGTRILVQTIVGYYKLGYTVEEILAGLPNLSPAQLYDALSYYHDHQAEIEDDIAASEDIGTLLGKYGLRLDAEGRAVTDGKTE
jgi:uncharacterized protein (DUF433 family)